MSEANMKVILLGHTQLAYDFWNDSLHVNSLDDVASDGQAIALSAIRNCYSPNHPSEIIDLEGEKYFKKEATDGKGGTDADRLIRQIMHSKHTSTIEHLSFTFSIEGVSRALLAQATRHRVGFSWSVKSQRYVKFGSNDKSGGFDYVVPSKVYECNKEVECFVVGDECEGPMEAIEIFNEAMQAAQYFYDKLREAGIPAEDARAVLPNAAATDIVMTANLRALLDFYSKRKPGRGGQLEITQLAEALKEAVVAVEPWTESFFNEV